MKTITYDMFKMQIDILCEYLQQDINENVIKRDYWPHFKKYSPERFDEIVSDLKENYEYNRFPRLADFYKAIERTKKPVYWEPPHQKEVINPVEYTRDIRALVKKFEIPDHKKKNRMTKLYREKIKSGEVWSHKLWRWVKRENMEKIGGSFVLPEDHM